MSFRRCVERLRTERKLIEAKNPASRCLEAAALIKSLEPKPVLFRLGDCAIPVAANICASRNLIAEYLNIQPAQIAPTWNPNPSLQLE